MDERVRGSQHLLPEDETTASDIEFFTRDEESSLGGYWSTSTKRGELTETSRPHNEPMEGLNEQRKYDV